MTLQAALPCVPSLLLMMDEEEKGSRDAQVQKAFDSALKDALEMIRLKKEEVRKRPPIPTQGNISRELRKPQPSTNKIEMSTADFLHMTAELEKINDDFIRRSKGTGEDDSKFLAVDNFDAHALDTKDKAIKTQCKRAQEAFQKKEYQESLNCLTELTNAYPTDRLNPYMFQNIAACYYKLEEWDLVLRSTKRALELNSELDVGYRRIFRTYMILERIEAAQDLLDENKRKSYWSGEAAAMKAYRNYHSLYDSHLYSHAMRELEALLRIIPCATFETLKVQLLAVDRTIDGVFYAEKRLKTYPTSLELKFWRIELQFRLATTCAELEQVRQQFEEAGAGKNDIRFRMAVKIVSHSLKLVRSVEKMKSEGKWQDLLTLCSTVLKSSCWNDGLLRCLLAARALAYIRLKRWYEAYDDAAKAMHYAEDERGRGEVFFLQACCEEGLQRWQDAAIHADKAHQLLQTEATERFLKRLKKSLADYIEKMRDREAQKQRAMEEEQRKWAERESKAREQQANQEAYEREARSKRPKKAPNSFFTEEEQREWDELPKRPKQQQQRQRYTPPSQQRETAESFFKVLGMAPTKEPTEVKKVYRALAMKWHPDKWSGRSPEEVSAAEKKFKEVQNAFENIMAKLK